jgi:hypothetical protein
LEIPEGKSLVNSLPKASVDMVLTADFLMIYRSRMPFRIPLVAHEDDGIVIVIVKHNHFFTGGVYKSC